jgi:hypothetical protein
LLGLWIDIDQFDLIDDPIAAREQAATTVCGQFFHIGRTEVGSISEGEEVSVWQAIFVGSNRQTGEIYLATTHFSEDLLFNSGCYS